MSSGLTKKVHKLNQAINPHLTKRQKTAIIETTETIRPEGAVMMPMEA